MFEDACCMCGKPTTGSLYCSNACKSQDYYPNLDDTPLLIPSRPHHSLSSSPTSSVMTTLSITDDLPPQVQPFYGTATAAAFSRTSMPPTPGEAPRRTPNSKPNHALFQPTIQETSPALVPRKHRPQPTLDVENTLHYVRRAAHQRSASSSTTSLLLSPAPSSSHDYNEQTMRNIRKQQRASLPAYFSLLETPVMAQSEPRMEAWAMPEPQYPKPSESAEKASVTPTIDTRGRSRAQSRSRSRGRTFARRTTPLASDSGSVSPTLVASLPGSPPDESISNYIEDIYPYDPFNYSLGEIELGRKRRRIDADYLIDGEHPNSHRPLKLARQLEPVPDHDQPMRYNAHTHNSLSNGNGIATNGKPSSSSSSLALVQPPWSTLYQDSVHDREQVVRVVLQALRDVGYNEAAATLERESGYRLESDDVGQLRHAVTTGLWDEAPAFLRRLGVVGDNERTARFLISQQKYLEQLEALQPTAALQTLRGELAVSCAEPERLHYLSRQVAILPVFFITLTPESSLIMCSSGADVMERAQWDGAMGTSRPKLLTQLQRTYDAGPVVWYLTHILSPGLISPSIMLPPRRLDTLLSHATTFQRSSCTHHAGPQADKHISLYVNHSCSRTQFPTLTTHILAEHLDEVWRLEWSHDGRYLASASQDKTAIIWKIGDLQPDSDPTTRECLAERVLSGHEYAVNALAWSPDDKILLTSAEHIIKMWDVSTGASLRDLQNDSHSDMITCLVWLPDGTGFVSGSMDCHIVVWNSGGEKLYELGTIDEKPLPIRVTDLTITSDGSRLVAVGTLVVQPPINNNFDPSRQTRSMKVFSLSSRNELFSVGLSNEVTSVKATADSRYVLISHAPDEVQLWDLDAQRMCQKYTGHYQGKHVIRSCLGGPDEGFVLSGSEDQTLYVWKRDTGVLIEVLSGHGNGCVNDVAWNPQNPGLFASCSDDHTIRLWCPPPPNLVGDRNNTGES
ncbi:unnamed protein product [Rhizoctonia solani]|uniref:CTLH domain-containing protein n=1 Tax=Rhizoctonia solani TaxID=456999 RepID=A0A8H3DYI3_9AGAM|nr:unnamed protein product [Rhizoctonia solani]